MSTVYQHQLHAHKYRRRHVKRWLAVALLVVGGGVAATWYLMKPNTQITNTAATTRTLKVDNQTEVFRKGSFSITLPKGWQFMSKQQDIYTIYHFRSALSGEKGNRLLDVYEDSTLPNFAVNRMVPVTATEDGGLSTDASQVSDNCSAYTTGATVGRSTTGQLAKWQGIEFLCDMSNTLRNVVGTGSKDGLNTVYVARQDSSVRHRYFFTFTENNEKPDYSIFIAALNSFKVQD